MRELCRGKELNLALGGGDDGGGVLQDNYVVICKAELIFFHIYYSCS